MLMSPQTISCIVKGWENSMAEKQTYMSSYSLFHSADFHLMQVNLGMTKDSCTVNFLDRSHIIKLYLNELILKRVTLPR